LIITKNDRNIYDFEALLLICYRLGMRLYIIVTIFFLTGIGCSETVSEQNSSEDITEKSDDNTDKITRQIQASISIENGKCFLIASHSCVDDNQCPPPPVEHILCPPVRTAKVERIDSKKCIATKEFLCPIDTICTNFQENTSCKNINKEQSFPPRAIIDTRFNEKEATVAGELEKYKIEVVLRNNLPLIRQCYHRQQRIKPILTLSESTTIQFIIDNDGTVSDVQLISSSFPQDATVISECLLKRFEFFSFPQPLKGTVTAIYPFWFYET
jgi:hypothetical protein